MQAILDNIKKEEANHKKGGLEEYVDNFALNHNGTPGDLLIQQPINEGIIGHNQPHPHKNPQYKDENPNFMEQMFGGVFMGMGTGNEMPTNQPSNTQQNYYPAQGQMPMNYGAGNQYPPSEQRNQGNPIAQYFNGNPGVQRIQGGQPGFFGQ